MEKFSKLKPKDEFDDSKEKVLYKDEHFQIIQFEDWSILKERDTVVRPLKMAIILMDKNILPHFAKVPLWI